MRQVNQRGSTSLPTSNWGDLPAHLLGNIFALSPTNLRATRCVNKHWHRSSYSAISDLQPDELNDNVTDFPRVENLDLSQVKVQPSDQDLNLLERLPKLKRVNLFGCWRLSIIGLNRLQHNVHLKSLNLSNCHQLIDSDAAALVSLNSIENLNLSRCSGLTDRAFAHISNLKELKNLNLINCENIALQPLIANSLRSLTKITAIYLSQNKNINDPSTEIVGALIALQTLEIESCSVSNNGISQLRELSELRTLNASKNFRVGQQILDIRQLVALENLNCNYCSIENESLAFLTEMKQLRALQLKGNRVTNQGIQILKNMTQLRELNLYDANNQLDPIAFEALTSLTSLECNIGFKSSQLERRLITHLPNLARLNNKDLSQQEIDWYRTPMNHRVNRSTKSISAPVPSIPISLSEEFLESSELTNVDLQLLNSISDFIRSATPPNLEVPEFVEHIDGDPKPNNDSKYYFHTWRSQRSRSFFERLFDFGNHLLKKVKSFLRSIWSW